MMIWLIHMWHDLRDLNHSCMTWLILMWHDSFTCACERECTMVHANESCHIRMSHVMHEWFRSRKSCMSHMNKSYHIWMRHVTYEWVMSSMNESEFCHRWTNHVTDDRDMSQMNEACHIHTCHNEWVMSHMNESCHLCMSHVTYAWIMSLMHESCHKRHGYWVATIWTFVWFGRLPKLYK
jgi:hypothetical protein